MKKYMMGLVLKIYPSRLQKEIIKRNSDAARWYYNEFVALGNKRFLMNREIFNNQFKNNHLIIHSLLYPNKITLSPINIIKLRIECDNIKQLLYNPRPIKNEHDWLNNKQLDSTMPQQTLRQYKQAWNMFRKVHSSGIPNFKRKSFKQNYHTVGNSVKIIDNKHLQLPKIGKIRCNRISNDLLKTHVLSACVKCDTDGYYTVSIQLSSINPFKKKLKKSNNKIGIDLNIENFYTDSNGEVVNNPRFYRKAYNKLKNAQRAFNRRLRHAKIQHNKLSDSKNLIKSRNEVARISRHVKNQRKNFTNIQSTKLIKNHDLIVVEDLSSKNMLKNHALAQSIQDVGWRIFINQLLYKAKMYNRHVVTINPRNTTQTCSSCGYILTGDNTLTLRDRKWTCPNCGKFHIRDHNAAINILNKATVATTD